MKFNEIIHECETTFNYTNYKDIQTRIQSLLDFFGSKDINKITQKHINEYVAELERANNAPATINAKLSMLNKILTYCYRIGYINHRPYIPYKKIKSHKDIFITPAEKTKMLEYCHQNSNQELWQVLLIGFNTGMRIQNILDLDPIKDIDNGYIRVWNNKTNRPYSIPLNTTLKENWHSFKKLTINYNQIYYMFNKMKEDLKLNKEITIHSLRHTFCSNLINKGVPVPVIQKLANHQNITTTMRYSHLNNETLEKAICLL